MWPREKNHLRVDSLMISLILYSCQRRQHFKIFLVEWNAIADLQRTIAHYQILLYQSVIEGKTLPKFLFQMCFKSVW